MVCIMYNSDSDYSDDELDHLNDTIYLHPDNPYVKPYINHNMIIYNGTPIITDNKIITMPKSYIHLASQIEVKACYLRWIIIFEIILNIPYCNTIYGSFFSLYTTIIGLSTICCTYNYNKTCMRFFLIYDISQLCIKFSFMIYIITIIHNNNFYKILHINKSINPYFILGGQIILTSIHIPIIYYVRYYYTLLPTTKYLPDSIVL